VACALAIVIAVPGSGVVKVIAVALFVASALAVALPKHALAGPVAIGLACTAAATAPAMTAPWTLVIGSFVLAALFVASAEHASDAIAIALLIGATAALVALPRLIALPVESSAILLPFTVGAGALALAFAFSLVRHAAEATP
jgi:hypothetical protein